MEILKLTDICKDYQQGKEPVRVLKNINMTVQKGDYLAIMGPSGSGKTTLMNLIGCLDVPTSGDMELDGKDLKDLSDDQLADIRNRHIGFVFQFHNLLPEFSALENVMMPALIGGAKRKEAKQRALELLEAVGLSERAEHKPAQLSGGEQQRVAIARALINRPSVVLADEPTGNLDTHNRDEIQRLLFEVREKFGQTIVMVTHDEKLAEMADRKIVMSDGQIR